jgi:hypothetical protein
VCVCVGDGVCVFVCLCVCVIVCVFSRSKHNDDYSLENLQARNAAGVSNGTQRYITVSF